MKESENKIATSLRKYQRAQKRNRTSTINFLWALINCHIDFDLV